MVSTSLVVALIVLAQCGSTYLLTSVETSKIEYKLPGHRGSCTAAIFHSREPLRAYMLTVLTASTDWAMLLAEIDLP